MAAETKKTENKTEKAAKKTALKTGKAGTAPTAAAEKKKKPDKGKKTAAKKTAAGKSAAKGASAKAGSARFSEYEGKTLVVVESPAKAKTLEKILGRGYKVLASIGHVRDLPKGRLAIDVENGFEPEYIQVRGKAELIHTLKGASSVSKRTLLASDPDREGEAIAWHLAALLGIDTDSVCRMRMQEITERGVTAAAASPDKIDMNVVDAQQARRVLDRLVGYSLSPLLWYKVQRGLSAGRVQSVALRLVCEREDEIDGFIPEEYWLVDAQAASKDKKRDYVLRVEKYRDKNVVIENEAHALAIEAELRKNPLIVSEFKTKAAPKAALPPFKTSTLQQEASKRLGFAPRRTMRIAQSLYEGIHIPGRGPTGLITYMRTDSLRLAPEAVEASRAFIAKEYGTAYLPDKPNAYVTKGKAQDAHEAIRATDVALSPETVRDCMTPEQFRLYELIWNRFVASQMKPAIISRTSLACLSGDYLLRQSGTAVTFDGWGKVYPLGVKDAALKPAAEGEALDLLSVAKEQKFTQPPARYSEAGLIKVLEEKGIGRPSTYASILETLSARSYVNRNDEDKRLAPTKLGRIVNTFLVRYFPELINVGFTAEMESDLDRIESGDNEWREVVGKFWTGFSPRLSEVSETAESMRPEPEAIGEKCPECGRELVRKNGRFGEFIACSGYPECKYTRKIISTTGVKCPKCGLGELVRRRASKGKTAGRYFYGCTRYPECDYVTWKDPAKSGGKEPEAEEGRVESGI